MCLFLRGLVLVSCQVVGLTWGVWDASVFSLHPKFILGADVLYDAKGQLLTRCILFPLCSIWFLYRLSWAEMWVLFVLLSLWWPLCNCGISAPEFSWFGLHNNVPQSKVFSTSLGFWIMVEVWLWSFEDTYDNVQWASSYWILDGQMGIEVYKASGRIFIYAVMQVIRAKWKSSIGRNCSGQWTKLR